MSWQTLLRGSPTLKSQIYWYAWILLRPYSRWRLMESDCSSSDAFELQNHRIYTDYGLAHRFRAIETMECRGKANHIQWFDAQHFLSCLSRFSFNSKKSLCDLLSIHFANRNARLCSVSFQRSSINRFVTERLEDWRNWKSWKSLEELDSWARTSKETFYWIKKEDNRISSCTLTALVSHVVRFGLL